mgnify:CR=1 FL=1
MKIVKMTRKTTILAKIKTVQKIKTAQKIKTVQKIKINQKTLIKIKQQLVMNLIHLTHQIQIKIVLVIILMVLTHKHLIAKVKMAQIAKMVKVKTHNKMANKAVIAKTAIVTNKVSKHIP